VKVEKPVTVEKIENNTQVEDNYVMSGIFNDSNFDDFGDWETGIEITDKDFDFFDDVSKLIYKHMNNNNNNNNNNKFILIFLLINAQIYLYLYFI